MQHLGRGELPCHLFVGAPSAAKFHRPAAHLTRACTPCAAWMRSKSSEAHCSVHHRVKRTHTHTHTHTRTHSNPHTHGHRRKPVAHTRHTHSHTQARTRMDITGTGRGTATNKTQRRRHIKSTLRTQVYAHFHTGTGKGTDTNKTQRHKHKSTLHTQVYAHTNACTCICIRKIQTPARA